MTDVRQALRERGYRLTPQRVMVWEVLSAEESHLSAEEVHGRISERYPNVNLSTVYRTLDLLVSEGLAREAALGAGRRVYETVPGPDGDHHHLVCRSCGSVEHIAARHLGPLQRHLDAEHGFEAERMVLTTYGRCRRCRSRRHTR